MDILEQIKTPEELLEYMSNNITYGFVGKNGKKYYDMYSEEWNDWHDECFVQSGEELLTSKIGTCWDQVELERLWFEKNNYSFKTIFSCFEVNRPNNLSTHTFLIYEKDGKWYWFEHAFESYRGIHEYDSEELAIEDVLNKQYDFSLKNNKETRVEDRECLVCYEYEKPGYHLGVDEYLDFVTSKVLQRK